MKINHKETDKKSQPQSVGGQALIEGVMMKGYDEIAMAVRKSDGEIIVKKEPVSKIEKSPLYKIPIIRGVIAFFNSMIVGVRAITYSAEVFEEIDTEEEKGKFEKWLEEKFGDKADDIITYFSVALAIAMALVIFMFIPTFLINFLKTKFENQVVLSGFEGILKIFMFIGYIIIISRLKEIRRVFEYHGAEHKVIFCYESGKPLTVENAREFTTLHPRCGTSFLVFVMVISIVLFSFIGWESPVQRVLTKLVLLPLVAGISYEIIKIAGKSKSRLVCMLSYPGLMLQKLTTKEPDDKQLEVAIVALKNVIVEEDCDLDI
ncbi:DUF1385 domain-containing protein [Paramaledivibacter caminithermalis]|jgi:uncharacterized protein YqhQ|uniref:Uncharacterized conserved protein YqhQ n=1 Tax=Paramaledivibacter caminithermalis (strain DSM 15212 / CIP 107654 / DViRD3) TaxID=1121301 RepID=A0A1M6L1X6_PARC5|nr:DUF1385 domain-containing protein [Paramaledivibacter caminithermalis]SHJ65230.1 Uncharacterized conserved protein YqhQ [Paramaledivibacter caminithermalis DSM 15212]